MVLEKIFIGLDPSFSGFGVYFSNDTNFCVETHKKYFNDEYNIEERISFILKRLFDSIKELNIENKDIIVGIEGYSFGSHSSSLSMLHELVGNIKVQLFLKGIKFYVIPPNSWKKFLFDNKFSAKHNKDNIIFKTYKKYGIEIMDNNICDAFNIMKFAQAVYKYENGDLIDFKEDEKKVLEKFFSKK